MTLYSHKTPLICYEGQSLANQPAAFPFPYYVAQTLVRMVHTTVAIGGSLYSQRRNGDIHSAALRVDPLLRSVAGPCILLDIGGTSDINFAYSAATIKTSMEAYWQERITAGWDYIIACTVPDTSTFDAAEDAVRVTVNNNIAGAVKGQGGANLLDAFVDFRLDATLEDWSSGAFTNDSGTYTHFTDATAQNIVAPRVLAVLQTAIAALA